MKLAQVIAKRYDAEVLDARDPHGLTMGLRMLKSHWYAAEYTPIFVA